MRRALCGQHPQTPEQIITWLEETVAGWNAAPTPLTWLGKRDERRQRARVRPTSVWQAQERPASIPFQLPDDPLTLVDQV
jgi:hypothetical protein